MKKIFEIIDNRIENLKIDCYEYSPNHPKRTAINARIDELRRLKRAFKSEVNNDR